MAITGGYDNVLKVWDLGKQMHLTKTLTRDKRYGHTQYIRVVKADFGKGLAVSGSFDNSAKVWDLNAGKLIRTLGAFTSNSVTFGHTKLVRALDVNFDTDMVFTAGFDKKVAVWNLRSGLMLTQVNNAHSDLLRGIAAKAGDTVAYCLAWGCTCQGLADHYGVSMTTGFFNTVPVLARKWFMSHGCQARSSLCKDYANHKCPATFCYLNTEGVEKTCTSAVPTPAPTPPPTWSPTAAPTKPVYHQWFKKIPVLGPILGLVFDLLSEVPIVGDMIKSFNKTPQDIFEKSPNLFDTAGDLANSFIKGGSFKQK